MPISDSHVITDRNHHRNCQNRSHLKGETHNRHFDGSNLTTKAVAIRNLPFGHRCPTKRQLRRGPCAANRVCDFGCRGDCRGADCADEESNVKFDVAKREWNAEPKNCGSSKESLDL
jgi:hypothetical protein